MTKINAGIAGGAGYTGGELVRLLLQHPHVNLQFVHSNSQLGKPLHAVHSDLLGVTDLVFSGDVSTAVDVLFLCVGHGEARKLLSSHNIPPSTKIIDLSQDFRLHANAHFGERQFVYGLPELNGTDIASANNIANPGCFATAIQLGLLPLAKAGLLTSIYTTGITGSTGAGQALSETGHFSWRANNIQAYKTLTHQHVGEIQQSLQSLQSHQPVALHFVPWRGDFTRGIFVSSQVSTQRSLQENIELFKTYYQDHPFVTVSEEPIFLKQVVNTNRCVIQLEQEGEQLVVHSAIDNLLKGASGQAVQNMNLLFGFEQTAGLQLKANFF